MTTLEGVDEALGGDGDEDEAPVRAATGRSTQAVIGGILLLGLIVWSIFEPKIRSTAITVVVAVAASGGLWVAANLLFDQVRERYQAFSAAAFGVIGGVIGILLHGNLITLGSGTGFFRWVIGPIVGVAIAAPIGYFLGAAEERSQRQLIGIGGCTAAGVLIGLTVREAYHPGLDIVAIVIYTAVFAAIGAGLSIWRKNSPIGGALIGSALGWIVGAWGGADLGDGSIATSLIAAVIPAVLIGVRLAMTDNPGYSERVSLELKSRAVIFVGPALLFIFILLVVPGIRTAYLSLLGDDSEEWAGLQNYTDVFTDSNSLDLSNWAEMFRNEAFWMGIVALTIAIVVGMRMKQRTGRAVEIGNPTTGPLIAAGLLLSFGVFSSLRGTLINNLWWVVVVTFGSTAMGLAIAVLADNRKGERFAKSIIFMPMALSLVGASIIWRFVYAARDTSTEQTGIINAMWVGFGKLSTGDGLMTTLVAIVLGLIVLGLLVLVAKNLTRQEPAKAIVPGILALMAGWVFVRFVGLFGTVGLGGFKVSEEGVVSADTVNFVQDPPYNNFWLMVVMIWIQTGFAMVILSAAMKAVPTELIEAARIDGATEPQVFWRVTLPQIATTVGVVVTTTIVGVMKVYDIVKVMTNGQFGTQVLANNMFQEAFGFQNTGKGAALAILIFLSVLPIMYSNIRNMQEEG